MEPQLASSLNGRQKKNEVDWSKYGLRTEQQDSSTLSWKNSPEEGGGYGAGGHQPADVSELFAGEQEVNTPSQTPNSTGCDMKELRLPPRLVVLAQKRTRLERKEKRKEEIREGRKRERQEERKKRKK
ncbi:hypothetical protein LSTR_LSTR014182 [Laodelphax striatellus]|uniref:Uncharacterized protein n=1 Tax=Laodelphax striatellus TaxID=195883 RepID=A0A482XF51_LAOST|nr:hypothetical protein LSTR_LSTR014182 [Laodelphax striatellus]